MAKVQLPVKTKKKLRYMIHVVVEIDPNDMAEIEGALESARGYGTAEIVDVEIVES